MYGGIERFNKGITVISWWAYNRAKNAFCGNFGQKRGVGLLSSEYGIIQ